MRFISDVITLVPEVWFARSDQARQRCMSFGVNHANAKYVLIVSGGLRLMA